MKTEISTTETPNGTSTSAFFELTFAPNLDLVSLVRRFVSEFYQHLLANPEATSRLAVATHELLENSCRSSKDGHTKLRIEVAPDGKEHVVSIRTWNRTSTWNLAVLTRAIEELKVANPAEYYLELLRRNAKRTVGSGLGLGRVRAEAEMTLSYELEGDVVCILAQARLPIEVKK